jgi:uncharacterized membrane protein YozB (DUF420 family)
MVEPKEYIMEWLPILSIDQFLVVGFWETRASLYIDIIVTYLVALPIFVGLSIYAATQELFQLHQVAQFLLFTITTLTLGLFAYYVHFIVGFDALLKQSKVDYIYAFILLVVHIVVAIVTMVLWLFTLSYAVSDYKRCALPGVYSESHKRSGRRVFYAIVSTSVSTALLYWVFFIFS